MIRLVHWCHGTVGLLPLLLEVEGLCTGEERARVSAAAERAGQVIWQRGLLLKVKPISPALCCVRGHLLGASNFYGECRAALWASRVGLKISWGKELCCPKAKSSAAVLGMLGAVPLLKSVAPAGTWPVSWRERERICSPLSLSEDSGRPLPGARDTLRAVAC